MSKRQAILKSIWSPFTAVFRTKHCAATASNLIVVKAGGEITGSCHDDTTVTKKARSSLEDLLRIEASSSSSSSNPEMKAAAADVYEPVMASPKNSSRDGELQIVLAFPDNGIAGRPSASGGTTALVRAPSVRVTVNRLVVLVPAALRARSRTARMIDAGLPTTKRDSYWRIAGRGGAGDKTELFYQRPIPLGRRCRVQHLEEGPSEE